MIKAAFFDIDGTLTSFKTHRVPESAERALAALRASGVATVVSTGRTRYQMIPELLEGFDAYITFNGQLCFDGAGSFRDCSLDAADVRAITAQSRERGYDLLVLQRDGSFASGRGDRLRANEQEVGLRYVVDDLARALEAPVYQICAFLPREEEGQILKVTEHVALTRWTDLFCDVVPSTGGKGVGWRPCSSVWAWARTRRWPLVTGRTTCRCSGRWAMRSPWATPGIP